MGKLNKPEEIRVVAQYMRAIQMCVGCQCVCVACFQRVAHLLASRPEYVSHQHFNTLRIDSPRLWYSHQYTLAADQYCRELSELPGVRAL